VAFVALAPPGARAGPRALGLGGLPLGAIVRVPKAEGVPVTIARVAAPRGVLAMADGDLMVLSMGPEQLVRVAPDGAVRPIVSGRPFRFPIAIVGDQHNQGLLVSDSYAGTIWAVSNEGEVQARFQGAPLVRPEGMAFDPTGALLVADPGAAQVFRVTSGGEIKPLL
jgi:sugar lactone lactonase YvrE